MPFAVKKIVQYSHKNSVDINLILRLGYLKVGAPHIYKHKNGLPERRSATNKMGYLAGRNAMHTINSNLETKKMLNQILLKVYSA